MLAGLSDAGGRHRKKLEEAARALARGDLTTEQQDAEDQASFEDAQTSLDEQFAALGLVPDAPVLPEKPKKLEELYIWPDNLPGWELFLSVQTQWRGGMQREGLDYPGVHLVIGQRRVWRAHRRQRFAEIQIMERACLDEWAKRQREGA